MGTAPLVIEEQLESTAGPQDTHRYHSAVVHQARAGSSVGLAVQQSIDLSAPAPHVSSISIRLRSTSHEELRNLDRGRLPLQGALARASELVGWQPDVCEFLHGIRWPLEAAGILPLQEWWLDEWRLRQCR